MDGEVCRGLERGFGEVFTPIQSSLQSFGVQRHHVSAGKQVVGGTTRMVGASAACAMPIGLDILQNGVPPFEPVSGMGVVVENARIFVVSNLKHRDGFSGIAEVIELPEGFNDATKSIDHIHCDVLVRNIAGCVVGHPNAAFGVRRTNADLIDVAQIRPQRKNPGSIGISNTVCGLWKEASVIVGVHLNSEADLMHGGETTGAFGFALGAGQRWQQQSSQDRNDGDDHQQFNERKCPTQTAEEFTAALAGKSAARGCLFHGTEIVAREVLSNTVRLIGDV